MSVPHAAESHEPHAVRRGAGGEPLPSLRDARSRWLLVLVLALQLFAWSQLEGYQLADSVEYMERANSFAIGDDMEFTEVRRSFGFSALLAPFFYLARLLGTQDFGWVVVLCRILQLTLGLALVHACHRLGARLGGRDAGWVAGLFVGINPIFLQYCVSPLSGIAAGLFLAWGLNVLLDAESRKRSLVGGLWLGASALMAYQSLVVIAPLIALVVLRNRRKLWKHSACVLAGLTIALGVQVVLDKISYGTWGVSLSNYLIENVGSVLSRQMWDLGFKDSAAWFYARAQEIRGDVITPDMEGGPRQLQSKLYYLVEIRQMLVVPVLALGVVGVIRTLFRPSWSAWILILTFAANVWVMSFKGSKSFRLWLPLLPLIAPICALGFTTLAGEARGLRRFGMQLVLVAALVLGVQTLSSLNTRQYGVFWQAADYVNGVVEDEVQRDGPRMIRHNVPDEPRIVSSYHWAVFGRTSAETKLKKLPYPLDVWRDALDRDQRDEMFDVLGDADWFIVHMPILDQGRDLLEAVNAHFDIVACFWNHDTEAELGPVVVMRKKGTLRVPRSMFEVQQRTTDFEAYRQARDLTRRLPERTDFLRTSGPGKGERVSFLGWTYETLEGDGFGWITYHFGSSTGLSGDYTIVDRLTTPSGVYAWGLHPWQNNHDPARGALPFSEWRAGTLLRESYLVQAGRDPFTDEFQPMGGAWRRGEEMVATLWLKFARYDDEGRVIAELEPALPDAERPIDFGAGELLSTEGRAADGRELTSDGLLKAGRFLMPIRAADRWPDDGSPDPD
jgi:glycosyl transferase family 22 (putative mannosyltransferase)